MTIDEAIKHYLDIADGQDKCAEISVSEHAKERISQCAADHRQLAEWLRELQELRLQIEAPKLGSIEEYHYELAKCKTAFWSCNRRCMNAEEQYRRKADELRKSQEQIAEYKRLSVNQWISVEDRLPEAINEDVKGNIVISDFVLVFIVYNDGFTYTTVDQCRVDDGSWLHEIPGEGCKVTHWMPLPEPPKDGDPE